MLKRINRRRGIGNVITTLIILIASVVLGTGVIFFGGSLFDTNTRHESIQVSNSHVWVSPSGPSIAAFVVQNTGDSPVAIQKISLRGLGVPVSTWYYNNSASVATISNIMKELKYDATLATIDVGGSPVEEQFTQATGAIALQQGQAMFVYLNSPANMAMLDAGFDVNLSVHSMKASVTQSVHVTSR